MNKNKRNKVFSLLLYFLLLVTVTSLSLDTLKYPGFFAKHFFIDSKVIFLAFIICNLFLRYKYKISFPKQLLKLNLIFIVPIYLTALFLGIMEFTHYPNYVLSNFEIHYQVFSYFSFLAIAIAAINLDQKILKKQFKKLLFFTPLILIAMALVIWFWPMNAFIELMKEDHLIEQLQSVFFFSGALIALTGAIKIFSTQKLIFIIYLLMSIALFLIAGEEISWGQRIIGFETEKIKELKANPYCNQSCENNANCQNNYICHENVCRNPENITDTLCRDANDQSEEFNFHNSSFFSGYISQAYSLLGFYGGLAWIFWHFLKKKISKQQFKKFQLKWLKIFIPAWPLSFYFLTTFIYIFYQNNFDYKIPEWSEFTEFLLALGIAIFMYQNYLLAKKYSKK